MAAVAADVTQDDSLDFAGDGDGMEVQPGDVSAALEVLAREVGVSPDKAAQIVSVVSRFSGPMPPPKVLEQYEHCVPGAADRILQMAEKEQTFRHQTAERALDVTSSGDLRGKRYALAVVVIMAAASAFCAWIDQPAVAISLGGGTLATIVLAFLGQQYFASRGGNEAE